MNILEEAAEITAGERQKFYGHPLENHGNTATLWSAYLQRKGLLYADQNLSARDVCMLMILLKISRDANHEKRDNLVDVAGYARNVEMIEERAASMIKLKPVNLAEKYAAQDEAR